MFGRLVPTGASGLQTFLLYDDYVLDDDRVDGVRLRLWTAATNESVVHPQVIHEYGAKIKLYWQGKFSDSSTRALWESYLQSSGNKGGRTRQRNWLRNIRNILQEADRFTSPPTEVMLWILAVLKNLSTSDGIEPTNIGSKGNHASLYTTEDDWLATCYIDLSTHQDISDGWKMWDKLKLNFL
jgi:hypothetical protein